MVAFYIIYNETAVKMYMIRQMSVLQSSYNREKHLRSIKHRLKASQRVLRRLKRVLERLKSVLRAA